jgi:hypothetical protein
MKVSGPPFPQSLFGMFLLLTAGCRAPQPATAIELSTWGTMREVLREGRSEARVALAGLAGPTSVGVGALEGLTGEVTVIEGRVLVAVAMPPGGEGERDAECSLREAEAGDRATLLLLADVPSWDSLQLGICSSYAELEDAISAALRERRHDHALPIPVRVLGRARDLALHVLAGACPIATPSGPPPWRWRGACDQVELVGFFAAGAEGSLTHHGRQSHLHAVAGEVMGHLDEVALEEAVLLLPSR